MDYQAQDYQPYLQSGCFYEASKAKDQEFICQPPKDWQNFYQGDWHCCLSPRPLAQQGWKIHLSVALGQEQEMLDVVSRYCFTHQLSFKWTRSKRAWLLKNSKYADRVASGKFITIYPEDEAEFVQTVYALAASLKEFAPGPYILSDRCWQASPVYYRYGAFKEMVKEIAGQKRCCLQAPDGSWQEDQRCPYYCQPDFVQEPAELAKNNFQVKGADFSRLTAYQIKGALHFSNGGGVYLARKNGKNYVIKEGRPAAGLDGHGQDAFSRIQKESAWLKKLAQVPEVVDIKEDFQAWIHTYLVEDYVSEQTLGDYVAENYPFYSEKRAAYVAQSLRIAEKLRRAVAHVHAQGVAIGDLQADNVMITEDGEVKLIDFEVAASLTAPYNPGIMTAGFSDWALETYEQADLYGLYQTIRFLFLPISNRARSSWPMQNLNLRRYFSKEAADYLEDLRQQLLPKCPLLGKENEVDDRQEETWPSLNELRENISRGIKADWQSPNLIKGDLPLLEDPDQRLTVDNGALGYGLLVARCGQAVEKKKFLAWLRKQPMEELTAAGLFTGRAGLGGIVYELGDQAWGRQLIWSAQGTSADLSLRSGLSGIALSKLALTAKEGLAKSPELIKIGEEIAAGYQKMPANGLMTGRLGAILALWKIGCLLKREDFKETAKTGLDNLLEKDLVQVDQHVFLAEDGRRMPYLANGTAGLALVLAAIAKDEPKEDRYQEIIKQAAETMDSFCSYMGGLFTGYAGLMLPDLALGRKQALGEKIRQLNNYLLPREEGTLVAASRGYRCSMDLAAGASGVLLLLEGIARNDASLWLPLVQTKNWQLF
ncbi:class III lanthionine synthetase LanKC [Lactobacillus equicursoris]|uniref:class III lanthionine synthetase LanKC n=1 Tax=Lactobacillus equicursoris TaxID=420645 RepID=UPI003993DECE